MPRTGIRSFSRQANRAISARSKVLGQPTKSSTHYFTKRRRPKQGIYATWRSVSSETPKSSSSSSSSKKSTSSSKSSQRQNKTKKRPATI